MSSYTTNVRKRGHRGTNDRGKRVRDSEGRLEGIELLPPQFTLIRESSFSNVRVCAAETGNGFQLLIRNLEIKQNTYPELLVIDQYAIHIPGRDFCTGK